MRLVHCRYKEYDFQGERFFPVDDYTIAQIIIVMCSQKGYQIDHLDFLTHYLMDAWTVLYMSNYLNMCTVMTSKAGRS